MNFFSTLKSRLLLLVLIAALPGLVMAVFGYVGERQRAIDHLHSDAMMFLHEGQEKFTRLMAQSSDESAVFRGTVQVPALPPGWVAMVMDTKGRILASNPALTAQDPLHFQGRELSKLQHAHQNDALVIAQGVDGVERWYATVPLGSAQNGVTFAVGGARSVLLTPIDQRLIGQMVWLLLFLAASLAFGWFFISNTFFRWARHALTIGRRFGAGEFDSRIDYRGNISELAEMSQTMNQLAEAIQQSSERVTHLSRHDLLTGLPNLALAQDRLKQDLVVAQHMNRVVALLLIDLNRFKMINDSLGLAMGDRVLQEMARRLNSQLREGDTVARLGGDEFAIILSRVSDEEDIALVASHVLNAIREQINLDGREFNLTANIGISLFPGNGADAETLFKTAKTALSCAQDAGRDSLRFFTAEMNLLAARQMEIEAELKMALIRNELELYYQPQASLLSGKIFSMEALLRWKSEKLGNVSPAEFIPVAEETGLILPIGSWVLRTACAQNKAWQDSGLPPMIVAVNFSAHQFRHPDALTFVRDTLQETGLPPQYLELELTESMLMGDVEMAIQVMSELKAIGISLSLDDFGTGYSSMSYLSRFSFNTLKIDQSFVRDITSNPVNATIATTTIAMAHSMHLNVVAEGVESESQLNFLRRRQCDTIQGYYFSRPIPAVEFAALIESGKTISAMGEAEPKPVLLLVDDEPDILHALQRVLRRDGYRILTATSAREGLELLSSHPVKVVVSDQRMPEMNGTEFLSRVKELHPATVRIMLTGCSDLKSLTDGINRGAIWKYLEKPWEERALRETLREAFRAAENRG